MNEAREILKKPYRRVFVPEEDGSVRGEIVEFPGCIATADSMVAAVDALEEVAESWLEASLANGSSVPEPLETTEYSGKLVLRLPKSLHAKAADAAKLDAVSLNQFIVTCIAESVGTRAARIGNVANAGSFVINITAGSGKSHVIQDGVYGLPINFGPGHVMGGALSHPVGWSDLIPVMHRRVVSD